LIEVLRLAERLEQFRLGAQRDVLSRPRGRVAMAEEIGREATPLAAEARHDLAPIIAVEEGAVHEQRRGPFPALRIGDLSDARPHVLLLLCHDGPFPL
jgi:hypothetical protein